jgi:hypothetical protein
MAQEQDIDAPEGRALKAEAAQTIAALQAERDAVNTRLECEILKLKEDADTFAAWWEEAKTRAEAAEAKVKELEAMLRGADEILMEHQDIADTAIRERDELRKALEPFVKACDRVDNPDRPDEAGFIGAGLTLGDLRRARASNREGGE